MSILICGNCGNWGKPFHDFGGEDGDYVPCNACGIDQTSQVTLENFDRTVGRHNFSHEEQQEIREAVIEDAKNPI